MVQNCYSQRDALSIAVGTNSPIKAQNLHKQYKKIRLGHLLQAPDLQLQKMLQIKSFLRTVAQTPDRRDGVYSLNDSNWREAVKR